VELLVSGKSKASATGGPLGNKFFLNTGGKCAAIDSCSDPKDSSTCKQVDRYIYIDNVPQGNIPFISNGMGVNFSEFKGIIPGAMGNLNALNPFAILRAFLAGSTPPCQQITMQTITSDNVKSSESHYVTLADITSMDPCTFSNGKNPVTGQKCKETFQTYNNNEILICDCDNQRISIWSSDGSQHLHNIQLDYEPRSIFIDPTQSFYLHLIMIGNLPNLCIYDNRKFNQNNPQFITRLGDEKEGNKINEFNQISSITMRNDDGSLIICDNGNNRIKIIKKEEIMIK
jgi:hypothetical protein